jgi:hypothetical protein
MISISNKSYLYIIRVFYIVGKRKDAFTKFLLVGLHYILDSDKRKEQQEVETSIIVIVLHKTRGRNHNLLWIR